MVAAPMALMRTEPPTVSTVMPGFASKMVWQNSRELTRKWVDIVSTKHIAGSQFGGQALTLGGGGGGGLHNMVVKAMPQMT